MSDMVKYRAAFWSFLKLTALVFYHVWHSPFFNEKKIRKDSADFWYKKNSFENQNFAIFDLQYQIKPNT